jgi:hypothetical protein
LASDLGGQISQRFEEAWGRWPLKQRKQLAIQMWLSLVTVDNEPKVFACLDRFLASDQAARGVIGYFGNWLEQQYQDHWDGEWPGPVDGTTKQQQQADRWSQV